jgi:hypothetical protein
MKILETFNLYKKYIPTFVDVEIQFCTGVVQFTVLNIMLQVVVVMYYSGLIQNTVLP